MTDRSTHLPPSPLGSDLVTDSEARRQTMSGRLSQEQRTQFGQFLTPAPVARLMASMFGQTGDKVHLLDAGAGTGSLTAAAVAELLSRPNRPSHVSVRAYELDADLLDELDVTMQQCGTACEQVDVGFSYEVAAGDFIASIGRGSSPGPGGDLGGYTHAILNPPYFKVAAGSTVRTRVQTLGVDVPNMYAAFVAAAISLLASDGELVAITPRSFCNGTYFRSFRKYLLGHASLRRVHVFGSRTAAFRDAAVLQENVIFHAVRAAAGADVCLSTSAGGEGTVVSQMVPVSRVVDPHDPEQFIHVDLAPNSHEVADAIKALPATLEDLNVRVSTGRVVDFRATEALRPMPDAADCVPLVYPTHLTPSGVTWPKPDSKKPNAIVHSAKTASLLVPDGDYVLVKRFSAKEERRRVVATVLAKGSIGAAHVGLENHLNYFHQDGAGLDGAFARGLALFLNSTVLDDYFRRFSGHTQVNATDLRNLRYPARAAMEAAGRSVEPADFADQARVDELAAVYFA